MYRRGIADAERDDVNPFYYRHYYPYKRGYDETRRRLRRPGVRLSRRTSRSLIVVLLVVAAVGWLAIRSNPALLSSLLPGMFAGPTPTVLALEPTNTALRPTRTPIFPSATPSPSPTATPAPELRVGGTATVTTEGLRARDEASLQAPIVVRFPQNERVTIVEGPQEADGYVWWRIEGPSGTGWSAQESPEGDVWLRPVE
jgi:hypothetical protein